MFPNPSANHPDANFPLGPSPQRTSTNKDRVCVFLILKTILEIQTKSSQPFLGCCNVIVLIIQNRNWEYDWWKLQRRPPHMLNQPNTHHWCWTNHKTYRSQIFNHGPTARLVCQSPYSTVLYVQPEKPLLCDWEKGRHLCFSSYEPCNLCVHIPACPASCIQGYFFLKDMTNGDQWTMFLIFFQDLCYKHTQRKWLSFRMMLHQHFWTRNSTTTCSTRICSMCYSNAACLTCLFQ